jgi:transposase InsO family protein
MDFIVCLPRTSTGYDSLWVIVDRLTKVAHFIPVMTANSGASLAELYMAWIVYLYWVPKIIMSDKGSQFTSRFWQKLHECLDTRLNFSSSYHPQTDGQTERTNQVLEDMLRACALNTVEVGIRVCPMRSSPTITFTRPVWRCPCLKLYMAESAKLLCIGIKLVKGSSLGHKLYKKQKNKSGW